MAPVASTSASRPTPKAPLKLIPGLEPQWTFTRVELAQAPSIRANFVRTQSQELLLRGRAVRRLYRLKTELEVPQIVVSAAATYVHRFYMCESFGAHAMEDITGAALFLAAKVEESPRPIREVISAMIAITENRPVTRDHSRRGDRIITEEGHCGFALLKTVVLHSEEVLLKRLRFDLTVLHPQAILVAAGRKVWERDVVSWEGRDGKPGYKDLIRVGWLFINDSLVTPLCLLHKAHVIAAAALVLASAQLRFPLPRLSDSESTLAAAKDGSAGPEEGEEPEPQLYWLEAFGDVEVDELQDAVQIMTEAYLRASDEYTLAEATKALDQQMAAIATRLASEIEPIPIPPPPVVEVPAPPTLSAPATAPSSSNTTPIPSSTCLTPPPDDSGERITLVPSSNMDLDPPEPLEPEPQLNRPPIPPNPTILMPSPQSSMDVDTPHTSNDLKISEVTPLPLIISNRDSNPSPAIIGTADDADEGQLLVSPLKATSVQAGVEGAPTGTSPLLVARVSDLRIQPASTTGSGPPSFPLAHPTIPSNPNRLSFGAPSPPPPLAPDRLSSEQTKSLPAPPTSISAPSPVPEINPVLEPTRTPLPIPTSIPAEPPRPPEITESITQSGPPSSPLSSLPSSSPSSPFHSHVSQPINDDLDSDVKMSGPSSPVPATVEDPASSSLSNTGRSGPQIHPRFEKFNPVIARIPLVDYDSGSSLANSPMWTGAEEEGTSGSVHESEEMDTSESTAIRSPAHARLRR